MNTLSKFVTLFTFMMILAVSTVGVSAGASTRKSCTILSINIPGRGTLKVNMAATLDYNSVGITQITNTTMTITGLPLIIQLRGDGTRTLVSKSRRSANLYGWGRLSVGISTSRGNITLVSRNYSATCIVSL